LVQYPDGGPGGIQGALGAVASAVLLVPGKDVSQQNLLQLSQALGDAGEAYPPVGRAGVGRGLGAVARLATNIAPGDWDGEVLAGLVRNLLRG
jgi:hypothetical protein